jgi:hypothetical protein
MLNTIALKSSRAAIIHVHRQGHGNGALWIHQPLAIVLIDTQVIGDDLKLITGHLKHVIVVNTHEINSQAGPVDRQMQVAICVGRIAPSTPKAATA